MQCEDALQIVQNMARKGGLDPDIVSMLAQNAEEIYDICMTTGVSSIEDYKRVTT